MVICDCCCGHTHSDLSMTDVRHGGCEKWYCDCGLGHIQTPDGRCGASEKCQSVAVVLFTHISAWQ